jgi:hypothetical protein
LSILRFFALVRACVASMYHPLVFVIITRVDRMNANQKQMVAEKINVGIVLKYFPIMGASERVRLALWLVEDAR